MNRFFPILLLTALPTLFLQADETSIVWERIYDKALNDQMRYEVMVNIRSLREPAFVPLLVNALTDVISRRIELGNTNEVDAKVRLATQIIDALGDLKDSSGADLLFQVYKEIKTFPLLRSDAAMALGKARASDYAIDLAKALDSINLQPDRDNAKAQEIVAFGLVQALAMMKDPVGFEPTFFASIGWYSPARKVKEIAKTMLKLIVDDPTESLVKIIKTQNNNLYKLRALEAEDDSKASPAQKSVAAMAALQEGVRLIANNIVESTRLSDLRKKALDMLIEYQDHTPEYVATYKDSYHTAVLAKDNSETLKTLQVLGVNGTPQAVALLTDKMQDFNRREDSKLTSVFDIQQIRTILQAFKLANSNAARPVLLEASFLYTPAVQRDIRSVMEGLPQ
jgi:hypothetical protein